MPRLGLRPGAAVLLLAAWPAPALPGQPGSPALRFLRDGGEVRRLDVETVRRSCDLQTITVDDPYYERPVRYLACPLATVLRLGLGDAPAALAGREVLFRARDGYEKLAAGDRVLEDGGFVALAESSRAGFAPLGRKAIDPGPFYVVWTKPRQRDTNAYPWPYQLEAIDVTDVARRFPRAVPHGVAPDSAAWQGFALFRGECIACHAVNGDGGKVGPDLNVPQSIVEYRPVEQLKRYIRNPAAFRYGNMPAHEHLSSRDLDALLAYFRVMKTQKFDPRGGGR